MATTAAQGVRYAGFWIRVVAALIDGLVLLVPNMLIRNAIDNDLSEWMVSLALGLAYFVGLLSIEGATVGKMVLGMKVRMKDGSPITPNAALIRYVAGIINVLTLGIGYLVVAFNDDKRGLHDHIAGTVVVFDN